MFSNKIKCENYVVCGNHKCSYNGEGECLKLAIALDASGKCVLFNPDKQNTAAPKNF